MESTTRVQILNKAICIARRANAIGKDMNLSATSQQIRQNSRVDRFLYPWYVLQSKRRKNSEFKLALFSLKIDIISHPVRKEGLDKHKHKHIYKKLGTVIKGDSKAPFSIATLPMYQGGRYFFPGIAPLYPWSMPYNAVLSKAASSNILWFFGMTRPGIEHWSPGPLVNSLATSPIYI